MKPIVHYNNRIFNWFLLVVILSIVFVWSMEEYLGIIAERDVYGYITCLVILPICLYLSAIKKKVAKTQVFVFFFLAFYLIYITTTSFIHDASMGTLYAVSSSLQWVPLIYIVAFLFLPVREALLTALGFYSLVIILLLGSYSGLFVGVKSELHAIFINAVLAQGVCILCLLAVVKLKQTRHAASQYAQKMKKVANIDGLLGIANRRMLQTELENLSTGKAPFSLLLIDIDHFKHINDTYGHLIGDDVLMAVTECMEDNLRPTDTLGRWGGEEFLLVAHGTNLETATTLAERIRHAVENKDFAPAGKVTISIGVTQFQQHTTIAETFSAADKALYQAKESGRNRVIEAQ